MGDLQMLYKTLQVVYLLIMLPSITKSFTTYHYKAFIHKIAESSSAANATKKLSGSSPAISLFCNFV
jgi:hypothetical protein